MPQPIQKDAVPHSIGIIMDGNRRWARAQNLPTTEGHRAGFEKVTEVMEWANEAGIKEVIVYAFSTENWKRGEEEVGYLMKLFIDAFDTWLDELLSRGVRIRFIGERSTLSAQLQEKMQSAEDRTKDATQGTLAIALSYGGRAEVLSAVNTLLASGREQVTEEEFRDSLWSAGLADPDLIIRTGGDQRLSNFLPWQSVYSELFFTETKWPDLSKEEFEKILAQYAARERRIGV